MMSALAIVISKLLSVSGVTGFVGNGDSPETYRIYPAVAPQGAPGPYILVSLVSEGDEQMVSGAARLYESLVTVTSIASSPSTANSMGEAVKAALEDVVKESITGKTGVDIYKASADLIDYNDDRTVFRRTQDFYVKWRG